MEQTLPLTAQDALKLWDAGEPVPAFQVETTPERQHLVYNAAFEMIRRGEVFGREGTGLSEREWDVAHSISHVAQGSGWAKMVSQHIHRDSPAISVSKPKE